MEKSIYKMHDILDTPVFLDTPGKDILNYIDTFLYLICSIHEFIFVHVSREQ